MKRAGLLIVVLCFLAWLFQWDPETPADRARKAGL
jgi:hypothetical protein